ncbi:copper resistance CopC family protein [Actinomadura rayongensis]|uniref:Copper resistance protein CopC n=1 Tax=Actinomadura rayongensis TaxID=1429076 RepID=A0A6I4W6E2_9ACTN|nr:copper resistance protein CopC [Actinomadura rayongensis]MXQ63835.1 copper resistance protein CopC [Actinomadura rayongensis]
MPRPRRLAALGLSAAALSGAGVAFAAPASAHTRLVSSTPAEGASVAAPAQVTLTFSDEIRVAKVVVKGADGTQVQDGAATRSKTTVAQKLKAAVPPGLYTVAYRVVGADGHPITAEAQTFTVAGGDAPLELSPAESTGQPVAARPAAKAKDSGGPSWAWIVGGGLLGILIGVGIVVRAKRRHPVDAGGRGDGDD